jgi:hypothetical protein
MIQEDSFMKCGASKAKKSQADRVQPAGQPSPLQTSHGRLRKTIEKEDLQWLAELQTVLSPYWSARFDK